ncbi:DMT family transporter [Chelatococcus reniformis]|uniref:Membrane protein n=1 Tax=Chelatococcus reniformis TaxID=1494448 RepID=A0A916UWE5_9HYPH|nr:DMT family transporter [Chelatococcus reniformis]GGC91733.1 membrane protein [Chelatococcus reniformis]
MSSPALTSSRIGRLRGLERNAYLLLTLTALMWAGNAVASRLAPGELSPMVITTLRWALVLAVLSVTSRRTIAAEWRQVLPQWPLVLALGGLGYTAFNALFYAAGHYTSAVNITLFQASIPIVVLIGSFLAYRTPISAMQVVGVGTTVLGVVLASTHGDLSVLRTFAFNIGDGLLLIACVLYAGYTVALAARPKVSGVTLFAAMAAAAFLTSLPLLAFEVAQGAALWPASLNGVLLVAYIGLFPSLLSQLFFMRGVELIGANRAGLFINLVPIFGALLGVLLLGERFGLVEALALVLVLGGIYVAERLGRPRRART